LEKGLEILAEIKEVYQVPVISDIHEPFQAKPAAEVIDVLQLPAFLCRQTDLVTALAETGRPVNVKKAQFLAAHEMGHIINKFKEAGNEKIMLCERGSSFGYNNLVVDPLNFGIMKKTGCPVVFDITHSLQIPGGRSDSADGRRQAVFELMLAGMSQGIAGLFLESHPEPSKAKCDGPCALPLDKLEPFLKQAKAMDDLIKSFQPVAVK
jgi:2-dehydro-3-deoxyphosphooctonate aldolase (KDO 8-P synthase)